MLVDLILADRRRYTFEGYATAHITPVLDALKIGYRRVYLSDGTLQDYLAAIEERPPSWTLSFSNLTPHQKPLCDILQIPHFYWVEGSFGPAIHFVDSAYSKIGLCDKGLCEQLPSGKVYFLPPGTSEETCVSKTTSVVMFADYIDLSFLEKTWKEVFAEIEVSAIRTAIERGLPLQAGYQFAYAEQYLNAQKTHSILKSLSGISLDVFGDHAGANLLLTLPSTTRLHAPLPYVQHLEVLKTSAIAVLNPASPWYWPAIGAGCLPLSGEREEIEYYLAHAEARQQEVERLAAGLPHQTWKKQTERLIEVMR